MPAKSKKSSSNVRVYVRLRPFTSKETAAGITKSAVAAKGNAARVSNPGAEGRKAKETDFAFDHCFDSTQPDKGGEQADVYGRIGKECLENAMNGYNACIFAYGQTGSGKSHTMMGDMDCEKEKGIIPRICEDLFANIEKKKSEGGAVKFKVEASYMEIYCEKVNDLLSGAEDLEIRLHPTNGPYVQNLNVKEVETMAQCMKCMHVGAKNRVVAATKMNERSSRSHAIFALNYTETKFSTKAGASEAVNTRQKTSRIYLVDLAGSERVKMSGVTGTNLEEAKKINQSLTTLGRIIDMLAERKGGKNTALPLRESLLTWLLGDSLGGNSKTIMMAAVSPNPNSADETLNTLRYAARAKCIVNETSINEVVDTKAMNELQGELANLQEMLRLQSEGKEKEIAGLSDKLQTSEEKIAYLQSELDKVREELDETRVSHQQASAQLDATQMQLDEARSQQEETERDFKNKTEQLENRIADLLKEIAQLQEKEKSLVGQVQTLTLKLAEAEARITKAEAVIETLKVKQDELAKSHATEKANLAKSHADEKGSMLKVFKEKETTMGKHFQGEKEKMEKAQKAHEEKSATLLKALNDEKAKLVGLAKNFKEKESNTAKANEEEKEKLLKNFQEKQRNMGMAFQEEKQKLVDLIQGKEKSWEAERAKFAEDQADMGKQQMAALKRMEMEANTSRDQSQLAQKQALDAIRKEGEDSCAKLKQDLTKSFAEEKEQIVAEHTKALGAAQHQRELDLTNLTEHHAEELQKIRAHYEERAAEVQRSSEQAAGKAQQETKELKEQHMEELQSVRKAYEERAAQALAESQKIQEEAAKMAQKKLEKELEALQRQNKEDEQRLTKKMNTDHEMQLSDLEKKLKKAFSIDKDALLSEHAAALAAAKKERDDTIAILKEENLAEIEKTRNHYEQRGAQMQKEDHEELERLKKSMQEEVQAVKEELEAQAKLHQQHREEDKKASEAELAVQAKAHQQQREEEKKASDAKLEQLKVTQNQELTELQAQIDNRWQQCQDQHQTELDSLAAQHAKEMEGMQAELDTAMAQERGQHELKHQEYEMKAERLRLHIQNLQEENTSNSRKHTAELESLGHTVAALHRMLTDSQNCLRFTEDAYRQHFRRLETTRTSIQQEEHSLLQALPPTLEWAVRLQNSTPRDLNSSMSMDLLGSPTKTPKSSVRSKSPNVMDLKQVNSAGELASPKRSNTMDITQVLLTGPTSPVPNRKVSNMDVTVEDVENEDNMLSPSIQLTQPAEVPRAASPATFSS